MHLIVYRGTAGRFLPRPTVCVRCLVAYKTEYHVASLRLQAYLLQAKYRVDIVTFDKYRIEI